MNTLLGALAARWAALVTVGTAAVGSIADTAVPRLLDAGARLAVPAAVVLAAAVVGATAAVVALRRKDRP